MWLIDLERTCSLLIGQSLGSMLIGEPPVVAELQCRHWLKVPMFSSGIRNDNNDIECISEIAYLVLSNMYEQIPVVIGNFSDDVQSYCKLALKLPCQYDEACALQDDDPYEESAGFYKAMADYTGNDTWVCVESENQLFEAVIRCFLITLLKHTGLIQKSCKHPQVQEMYRFAVNLRQKMLNSKFLSKFSEDKKNMELEDSKDSADDTEAEVEENLGLQTTDSYEFRKCCQCVLERCLFLLIFVKGKNSST